MTKVAAGGVPVRHDHWKPVNPQLDSVIRKYIDEARRTVSDTTGNSATLTGGALVLVGLGLVLAIGTGNPVLAIALAVVLALGGMAYTGLRSPPLEVDQLRILRPLGGPGNLPAGYLVHPLAWRAGMPEYLTEVARVPERRMRIAVELCHRHPGAVVDLLRMVERAEWFVAENKPGHDFTEAGREAEILAVATQDVEEHVRRVSALASGKKAKKKKRLV
ncbi:hypothetical protein Aca07nite_57980 [Actinoplanes capillaceus]|uniref:DUF2207 domain-containing protein n=1 Tax=Actinoplanes campanulatus TaxID=113559 RepID=A0ABQ3WQJ4_9ACTN|nr:hypothetical protein [Actinoplanes capillaceus]GID48523.1 hypothetical protein Aca07nite_57980 [Actinoplanes capillaceus]